MTRQQVAEPRLPAVEAVRVTLPGITDNGIIDSAIIVERAENL